MKPLADPISQVRRLCAVRFTLVLARHWLAIVILALGVLNVLPFLAPVAMRLGWTPAGNAIYSGYSLLCHQMAQRSLFLFGPQPMYNLDSLPLQLAGKPSDLFLLRDFRGNEATGWKVAWSDRMVAIYGSLWFAGMAYGLLRRNRQVKPISIWVVFLLMLPMVLDGMTHMISDLNGLSTGFRYGNEWLASLTAHSLPDSFYRGDTFGSFNSWMRLISGGLFGTGMAALGLPLLDRECRSMVRTLSDKLVRYGE